MFTPRLCLCGSGLFDEEIMDGHGIYLCRCCSACREEKLACYRDDILDPYDPDEPDHFDWPEDYGDDNWPYDSDFDDLDYFDE